MPETNQQRILRVLLEPANVLETVTQQCLTMLHVDTAVGIHLTRIGLKVGAPRAGILDDEVFRRIVRATITANRSSGIVRDINRVARLVVPESPLGTIVNRNVGQCAYILTIEGVEITSEIARALVRLIIRATSDGVRAIIGWTEDPVEDSLFWDTDTWDDHVWWFVADKEII